ncbi:extracellular solute-binding protein [Natronospora cellulosivora (SeqCode)]
MVDKSLDLLLMVGSTGKMKAEEFLKKSLNKFEVEEDVKVNLRLVTWNRAYESIISAFKSNNSPDVFQLGTTWVQTLSYLNYLHPIKNYNEEKNLLADWIDDCCHYQEERYALPWLIDTVILAARKDIIDDLGIDINDLRTWQGFYKIYLDLVERRRRDPSFPKALSFSIRPDTDTLHRFMSWYFANNESFSLDIDSNKVLSNQTEILDTLKYLQTLIRSSDITVKDVDKHPYQLNEDFYKHGSYVFYLGHWYGVLLQILGQDSIISSDLEFIPLLIPSENSQSSTNGGGSVLSVSSKTKHPILAQRLINFLCTEEFSEGWLKTTANTPAYETRFWQKRHIDERISTLYNLVVNSKTYPFYPGWTNVENILSDGISRCMWRLFDTGLNIDLDIKSLLSDIDQSIVNILKMSWQKKNC